MMRSSNFLSRMNLAVLILGVFAGWSVLLLLPWSLTGNLNPFSTPAGLAIVCPMILPVYFLLDSDGCGCPTTTHQRLAWFASVAKAPKRKLLLVGIGSGLAFTVPSASIFTLLIAYGPSPSTSSVSLFIILIFVGIIHLTLFILSIFAAVELAKSLTRRTFTSRPGRSHRTS